MVDWGNVRVREVGRPHRKTEPFAMVPLAWAAKAASATHTAKAVLWLWLVAEVRRTRSDTVTVSNEALAKYGVSRKVKYLGLEQLEKAGLVSVKRHGNKAPIVQLLP